MGWAGGGGAQGGARADVIRRLLARLTLVPGRKALVVDAYGRIWCGRIVFSLFDVFKPIVLLRMTRPLEPAVAVEPCACASYSYYALCVYHSGVAVRSLSDEGLSWCRGWSGAAAEALHVATALT